MQKQSQTVCYQLRRACKLKENDQFKNVYLTPDRSEKDRTGRSELVSEMRGLIEKESTKCYFIRIGKIKWVDNCVLFYGYFKVGITLPTAGSPDQVWRKKYRRCTQGTSPSKLQVNPPPHLPTSPLSSSPSPSPPLELLLSSYPPPPPLLRIKNDVDEIES